MARLTLTDLPTRRFKITRRVEDFHSAYDEVDGHVPQIENGVLSILRYGGDSLWPVRVYAAGAWINAEAEMLSEEGFAVYAAMAQQQEADKLEAQRSAGNILIPQLAPNQGRRNH